MVCERYPVYAFRVYAHLLLVLDDTDFHNSAQPFSTGQARAIATSLNSLVFHTCFPAASSTVHGARQSATTYPQNTGVTAGLDADTLQAGKVRYTTSG